MNECCCSEKETSIVHPTFLSSSPQRKWWMSWCFHSTIYLLGGRDWRWMGLCGEPEVFNIHPHFHQESISFALHCQWAQSLQSFWPTTTGWEWDPWSALDWNFIPLSIECTGIPHPCTNTLHPLSTQSLSYAMNGPHPRDVVNHIPVLDKISGSWILLHFWECWPTERNSTDNWPFPTNQP